MKLNEAIPMVDVVRNYMDELESNDDIKNVNKLSINGLSTSYSDLDEITSGLKQGLYVIAGSSEMRTDILQRNIIENVSLTEKKPVLHFEFNLNQIDFTKFLLSSLGRIDFTKISKGNLEDEDWSRISLTFSLLAEKMNLEFCDCAGMTTTQLTEQIQKVHENKGLSMITINSMHNLRLPHRTENRYNEMTEISRYLKELSKKYEVPVVVTSSVNRKLIERSDKRPLLHDLRDTGTISDDADCIMLIYRDEVYHDDSEFSGLAEIIVSKNIFGSTGRIPLTFQKQYSRFDNYAGPYSFN